MHDGIVMQMNGFVDRYMALIHDAHSWYSYIQDAALTKSPKAYLHCVRRANDLLI